MEDLFKDQKRCLFDKTVIKGRSDKKFCSLKCKNSYNNQINRDREKVFDLYEKRLHKNHGVLKMFYELSKDEKFIQITPLYQYGFNPRYYIGTMKYIPTGEIVHIVYDYAFLYDPKQEIKIFYHEGGFHNT
jgi:hypothetical protein